MKIFFMISNDDLPAGIVYHIHLRQSFCKNSLHYTNKKDPQNHEL